MALQFAHEVCQGKLGIGLAEEALRERSSSSVPPSATLRIRRMNSTKEIEARGRKRNFPLLEIGSHLVHQEPQHLRGSELEQRIAYGRRSRPRFHKYIHSSGSMNLVSPILAIGFSHSMGNSILPDAPPAARLALTKTPAGIGNFGAVGVLMDRLASDASPEVRRKRRQENDLEESLTPNCHAKETLGVIGSFRCGWPRGAGRGRFQARRCRHQKVGAHSRRLVREG